MAVCPAAIILSAAISSLGMSINGVYFYPSRSHQSWLGPAKTECREMISQTQTVAFSYKYRKIGGGGRLSKQGCGVVWKTFKKEWEMGK